MFADIIFWPQEASTTARQVDVLLYGLVAVTGAVAVFVMLLMIFFAVYYRRRPGHESRRVKNWIPLELFWTLTPLGIFMVFFVWGAIVYYNAYRPPDNATVIYGIGKQWMWKFQHPEGQREINELHVPVDEPFQVILMSEDVVHSFFVPAFRIHMDVIPNRYTSLWFHATKIGTYQLECSQYCGTGHSDMVGRVIVMSRADYDRWLKEKAEGSMALQGRKVFYKHRCISCHHPGAGQHAPILEGLYDRPVHLNNGQTVIADSDYLRRSILDPGAQVVEGWRNIMPTFKGKVSEEEILQLIAFIQSLHQGDTPPPVGDYPPPVKGLKALEHKQQKKESKQGKEKQGKQEQGQAKGEKQ